MQDIKLFQVSLAVILFGALAPMPYFYYELLRVFAVLLFSFKALIAYKEEKTLNIFINLFLLILFQPFYKLVLGKFFWNSIDVLVGTYLIISLRIFKPKLSS